MPLKTIGALQEENLVLARTIRELEQICKPDNEECESDSNGSTCFDNFRHYSRIYGHMVNMFMTVRECKLTKETTSYNPGQWFGQQWKEGNFRKLLECIPSEFMDGLDNEHDAFTKHVEFF